MYYLTKVRDVALNNGEDFHLVAILFRKKHVVRIGTNSRKTHPKFGRKHLNGKKTYYLHAETDVLRFAKSGDKLLVIRYNAAGEATMAKPCLNCQKHIREIGIKKVYYTDWDGNICKLRF